jgi:hypothetical protein
MGQFVGPDDINGPSWCDPIIIGLHIDEPSPASYGPCVLMGQPDPFYSFFFLLFIQSFLCHFDVLVYHNYQFYRDMI